MRSIALPCILALITIGLLTTAGCKDPAADVPEATVESPAEGEAATEGEATGEAAEGDEATEGDEAAEEPAADSVELAFTNETSSIGFTGSKVTGSHDGGFNEFAGTVTLVGDDATASSVEVTIQMASVFSDSERLTGHLQNDDFFDVPNHPTGSFRSTAIVEGGEGDATHTMTGELTLRGTTQTISFPASIQIDDTSVKASAEFSINRMDFGISYAGRQDDLIRELVVLRLNIDAPRG
jgi:polyisoprenoid-binding protein YceI